MSVAIHVVSPKNLIRLLAGIAVFLTFASIVGQYSKYYLGHAYLCGFVPLFYGETHGNIPHWFKAMCMLISSVLLFFIYQIQKDEKARFQKHWLFLSIIFLLMNLVQSADIHNALSPCIRSWLGIKGGWFYYTWVIPAILFVMAVGITYLRFFINLPSRTRLFFFITALLYVTGAIAFEMATAYYRAIEESFTFAILSACHEGLKMAGLVLFIHTLMDYWRTKNQAISLLVPRMNDKP